MKERKKFVPQRVRERFVCHFLIAMLEFLDENLWRACIVDDVINYCCSMSFPIGPHDCPRQSVLFE